jgi:predicted transcriptional regulator
MPKKREKSEIIKIEPDKNVFNVIFRPRFTFGILPRIPGKEQTEPSGLNTGIDNQFSQISKIRKLLSHEKVRLLYTIKHKKPASVYRLAKLLDRDFKAVRQDLRVLEDIGFIMVVKEKVKGRVRARPVLEFDKINFSIEI